MEIFILIVLILGLIGIVANQTVMNKKLNDIYTEVAEMHEKMGGWSADNEE